MDHDFDIQHKQQGAKGAFFIEKNGHRVAEMTYSLAGMHRIIIDHTEVKDELRGQGAGRQLVDAAVEWARNSKKKVLPLCPFAKSMFQKDASIRDVLN